MIFYAFFAISAISVNAFGSDTAISASIFLFIVTFAFLRPAINLLYVVPFNLAAAFILAIHNFLKSLFLSFLPIYAYVNDAIGFRMETEVVLVYSERFFGTADAISFRNNVLRIHDLKTGKTPVHMEQLMIYAALFCLEYKVKPGDIKIELRIYQNDEILYHDATAEDILPIMNTIITWDKILAEIDEEV